SVLLSKLKTLDVCLFAVDSFLHIQFDFSGSWVTHASARQQGDHKPFNRVLPEGGSSLSKRTATASSSASTQYSELPRPTAVCRRRGRKNLRCGDRACKRMTMQRSHALYNGVALSTDDDDDDVKQCCHPTCLNRFPRVSGDYNNAGGIVDDRTYGSVVMPIEDERSMYRLLLPSENQPMYTGNNLWQYQALSNNYTTAVSWPYMATAQPWQQPLHTHTAAMAVYGSSSAANSAYFIPRMMMFPDYAHLHSSAAPILVTDDESEKGDAASYGYPYTPDTGGVDGRGGYSGLAVTVDEGLTFLRGLMTILLNMIEIGDAMESSRIINNSPVNHPEFTGSYIPYISVWSYLERLSKYFHCSSECFVLALVYLDRAVKATAATSTPLYVTSYNVHRLILTSLVLAVKFNDDFYYSNKRYAEVGCLTSTVELNRLEAAMLKLIDFSLYVGPDEYVCYWKLIFSVSPMSTTKPRLPMSGDGVDDGAASALPLSSSPSSSSAAGFGLSPSKNDFDDIRLSRSHSTDGSSGCGPSTKASTVVPWPSPSTDADSDVVEASSSASSSLKHHRRSDPRSSSDGSSRQEVAGDTLDRTDLAYFLPALTKVLDHLIYIGEEKERSMLPNSMPLRSRYHSVTVPNISVSDYLSRLARFFNCSGECFVIALIYLDRAVKESTRTTIDDYDDNLTNAGSCWEETTGAAAAQSQKQQPTNQSFNITRLNIHRLLLTALTLAAKYYDDCYYANKRYAEVGGVSTRELNSLEASFLDMIHYRLFVAPEEYSAYKEQVENVLNPPTPTPSTPSSPSTYCSSV
ncbi:mitochondrial peripheral inner membrane protein, partial [Perkinsus chesapeaki]